MTAMMMKALTMLNAHGARYRIELPDGTVHGDLALPQPETVKRRAMKHPYGTMTSYVRPFMQHLVAGELAVVPIAQYTMHDVQNACGNCGIAMWGKGSVTTAQNVQDGTVEVLRLA